MKEQIQKKIRERLDESMTVLKRNMAKVLGLEHQAYDVWKNLRTGDKFIWNKTRNTFDKYEVKDSKIESQGYNLKVGNKVKLIPLHDQAKQRLRGQEVFKVFDVKEDGNSSAWLDNKKGYNLQSVERTDNGFLGLLVRDIDDAWYKIEKL